MSLSELGISVETTLAGLGGKSYPVYVKIGDEQRMLTVEEAEELHRTVLRAAQEAEDSLTKYVQVKLGNYSYPYTYLDPTGAVEVGDTVTVSGTGRRAVGTVVALGRGSYQGHVYEQVTGKVVPLAGQGEGA